jgi:predicted RNA binding protein YcfA (HicA-like mRNA interferase family)
MSKLPCPRAKQVIVALRRVGFEVIRIRGSHHFLRHPDGHATVVPSTPANI